MPKAFWIELVLASLADSLKRESTHSFTNRTSKQLSPFSDISHYALHKPLMCCNLQFEEGFRLKSVRLECLKNKQTKTQRIQAIKRANCEQKCYANKHTEPLQTASVFESPRTGKNQNKLVVWDEALRKISNSLPQGWFLASLTRSIRLVPTDLFSHTHPVPRRHYIYPSATRLASFAHISVAIMAASMNEFPAPSLSQFRPKRAIRKHTSVSFWTRLTWTLRLKNTPVAFRDGENSLRDLDGVTTLYALS